jgi:hypothetical protein
MSREADVARVTAAINTPGLRYRSFGNALPRPQVIPSEPPEFPLVTEAIPAPPAPAAPDDVPDSSTPPAPVMRAAPVQPEPEPEPEPERDLPFAGQQEAPAPPPEPAAPPPPVEPPPPAIDWAALAAPPLAAPSPPPTPMLPLPPTPAQPLELAPEAPAFRLLEAIGHAPSPAPSAPPGGGTLAMLKASAPAAADMAAMPLLNPVGAQPRGLDPAPGHLPAHAVTVPLSEVMRLIAAGAPPAASPFDAFRAALRPRGTN